MERGRRGVWWLRYHRDLDAISTQSERDCMGRHSMMKVAEELLSRAVGGTVFDEILVLSRFFLYVHGECVDFENETNRRRQGVRWFRLGFDLDAIL